MGEQLLGHPLLLGDVLLDGQVMGDGAVGLAHRGDIGHLDVFAAVLAAVDQFALPRLAPQQRGPHLVVDLDRGAAAERREWTGRA
jgi:hypothetical protein